MEPRARIGKNRGQQTFSDQELQLLLYSHGDVAQPLAATKRVLDDALTDFITNVAFETAAAAALAGRQKIKVDDVRHACRRCPRYLGRLDEAFEKKHAIESAKTLVNVDKNLKDLAQVAEEGKGGVAGGVGGDGVGIGGAMDGLPGAAGPLPSGRMTTGKPIGGAKRGRKPKARATDTANARHRNGQGRVGAADLGRVGTHASGEAGDLEMD